MYSKLKFNKLANFAWLSFLILSVISVITVTNISYAQVSKADELKRQIDQRQSEISRLDEIIAEQEKELTTIAKKANTLQNELATINLTVKKLDNQISRTKTEIESTTLKISELNSDIKQTTSGIEAREETLRELIRERATINQDSLPVVLLNHNNLSDFLATEEQNLTLQSRIRESALELKDLKTDLGVEVKTTEAAKNKLLQLQREFDDQKKIAAAERTKQSNLLTQTKNQEQNYKKLLTETKDRREAFARELESFESQLRLEIDQDKIPPAGKGILAWPVAKPFVTQYFGKTLDAKRLYASGTHNGVDFRASVGTPILASASGVVAGTGDTDIVCRGASYGRWVLIKHDNGLATLSAHLSLIKVTNGQRVAVNELIGYSGQTGYATGPHLHFTVAASQGVEIRSLKSKVCPGTYTMPVFDTRAYLDPILYL